jgi:hypothetical protein
MGRALPTLINEGTAKFRIVFTSLPDISLKLITASISWSHYSPHLSHAFFQEFPFGSGFNHNQDFLHDNKKTSLQAGALDTHPEY